jgi:hypothetical protein
MKIKLLTLIKICVDTTELILGGLFWLDWNGGTSVLPYFNSKLATSHFFRHLW